MDDLGTAIACARDGDEEALASLITRFQGLVRTFLATRLGNHHDADDLAQETFLVAYRRLPTLPDTPDVAAAFAPWLLGIARNLLRNHRKIQRRRRAALGDGGLVDLLLQPSEEDDDHPEVDVVSALRECLQRMDGDKRQLLQARYADGQSIALLCQRFDQAHSAMTMALHRLRQWLRLCIETKAVLP